jgi:hypothetical protein
MDIVGKCFDLTRRNLQWSVKHSGATTPRKKLLGSIEKTFEIITYTYLLAFSKLEGELHLKGASL